MYNTQTRAMVRRQEIDLQCGPKCPECKRWMYGRDKCYCGYVRVSHAKPFDPKEELER